MTTKLRTAPPNGGFVIEDCLGLFVLKLANILRLNAETASRVGKARIGLSLPFSVSPIYLRSMLLVA